MRVGMATMRPSSVATRTSEMPLAMQALAQQNGLQVLLEDLPWAPAVLEAHGEQLARRRQERLHGLLRLRRFALCDQGKDGPYRLRRVKRQLGKVEDLLRDHQERED